MKTIKLKRIELTNFKGIAHRVEEFSDGDNFIYGANGTGKSSIFDAFTWLLFGKDSHGQSEDKAKIKMMDADGKYIMHTDNVVEGVFEIDGEELTLKRTYEEKWRKPSGKAESVYDGQTTTFSWNGNEKIGSTEYKKRVGELIDESLFKLITDPLYFASLDPKERRKTALALAGEVSDDVIRASNVELKCFDPSNNIDEKRSIAISVKNRLIKDRDNYPARIDELMKIVTTKEQEIKELNLPDREKIEIEKEQADKNLKDIEEKQANASMQVVEITKQNEERLKLLNDIEEYKAYKQREADAKVEKENEGNHRLIVKKDSIKSEIASFDFRIAKAKEEINDTNKDLQKIKNDIKLLTEETVPDFDVIEACPTCGKAFDVEDIQAKKEEMRGNWVLDHNKRIERLKDKGNSIFEKGKTYKAAMEELEKKKLEKQKELDEVSILIKDDIPYVILDFKIDPEYKELLNRVPQEVSIPESITNYNIELENKKAYYKNLIEGYYRDIAVFTRLDSLNKDIENAKSRIELLKHEQLEVNQGVAKQEQIIYLCDLWMKTKIDLLNQFVSSKFDLVKFKMFNYTKEGNAVPTCEITVDGVDYTALNTASKINAGLDIINALINYYQVKAPIFIDNRESVTNIIAPDTQVVNLVVTN